MAKNQATKKDIKMAKQAIETIPKMSKYEHSIGAVLIDELANWESTTQVPLNGFIKLVKRLAAIKNGNTKTRKTS